MRGYPEDSEFIQPSIDDCKEKLDTQKRLQLKTEETFKNLRNTFFERLGSNIEDWREDQKIIFQFMDKLNIEYKPIENYNVLVKDMQFRTLSDILNKSDQEEMNYGANPNQESNDSQNSMYNDSLNWRPHCFKIYQDLTEIPNAYRTPWLVSWCMNDDKETICHFSFQFINLVRIGMMNVECSNCTNASNCELRIQHSLSKILVQKNQQTDKVQAVILIDDQGVLTSINAPNVSTMFDQDHWKVFTLENEESLINVENTGSFENIKFTVCRLPKLLKKREK